MIPPRLYSKRAGLTRACDYRRVYKEGKLVKAGPLRVYILERDTGEARLGISIPRAAAKKAVTRNRIKRIIRAWFQASLPAGCGSCSDIVVVLKRPIEAGKKGSETLRETLNTVIGN